MTVSAVRFLLVATPTCAYIMRPPQNNRRRWLTAAHAACCFVTLLLNQAPGCKGAQDVVKTPPSAAAGIAVNGLQIPANLTTVAATTASGTRVKYHTMNAAAKRTPGAMQLAMASPLRTTGGAGWPLKRQSQRRHH